MKRPQSHAKTPEIAVRTREPKPAVASRRLAPTSTARMESDPDIDDTPYPAHETPYKPPPKHGRWPKGKSGNNKGRKAGSKNKKTVIIEMMEAKLGRKIPDPRKMTRYEAMMFKAIQKALGGDIRSMGFVLTEYRKAIESSGAGTAAATTEEDQQAYGALCAKIRREIVAEASEMNRNKVKSEVKK